MSMSEVIKSIECEALNRCANNVDNDVHIAIVEEEKDEKLWIHCPYCRKKQFPLSDGAHIIKQQFICKGSGCKKTYIVNI